MKVIQFDRFGQPADILKSVEVAMPEPNAGHVRIRVVASPINPSDLMFVQNRYGIRPQLPSLAGFEGMGVIDAVGEGVSLPIGSRVSFTGLGSWGEYVVVPHKAVIPVPDAMTDDIAAQLFVNPFTAYAMVQDSGVPEGGWLMLTAAGSAFGKLVIQLCVKRGIKTIGTVRRNDLNDELTKLGLTEIINTETDDMAARVREITSENGVQCVLDAVGGQTATDAVACLGKGGTMLIYGLLSAENPSLNVGLMIFRELTIKGFWLSDWMRRVDTQVRQEVSKNVIEWLTTGEAQLPIDGRYTLDQIAEAVDHADRPGRWGKILITP